MPNKKKRAKVKQPVTSSPMSLQSLCVLHLPREDTRLIQGYSQVFRTQVKDQFWREVREHPDLLAYDIDELWLQDTPNGW